MRIKRKNNNEWSEKKIQDIICGYFFSPSSIKYHMENLCVYGWESDVLLITKSDITYEFEIKISRGDFKNDFKHKKQKHQILEGIYKPDIPSPFNSEVVLDINKSRPNYFYYAVPENLIQEEEVPVYAGLICITEIFPYYKVVKSAPKLTDEKIDYDLTKMRDKFYYNYREWKRKAENEIEPLKELLNESRTDEDGTKYKYNLKEANELLKEKEIELKSLQKDYDRASLNIREYLMEVNCLTRMLIKEGHTYTEIEEILENKKNERNGK